MWIHHLVIVFFLPNRIYLVHIVYSKQVEFIINFENLYILVLMKFMESGQRVRKKKSLNMKISNIYLGSCHETAVLNPTNPYAATKAAAEFLVKSYGESFKLPYVITRGNNVYGPYQFPEKVIPRFITLIMNNEKMTIQGDGKQVRNFIYVTDTVRAVDLVLRKGKTKMIYNIGSNDEIKVLEIASILLKIMKPDAKLEDTIIHIKDRYFNDCRYSVMIDALESLGWKQQVKFEDGIRMTVKWYQENPNHWQTDGNLSID